MISFESLPTGIHQFFTTAKCDENVLLGGERDASKTFGQKRLTDFSTGRYCLRQSTAPIGYRGEIPIGEKGMPSLPQNITASVSHSNNLCGAIAANKHDFLSVGIDIETRNRVHKEMWHLLFTDNETRLLQTMDAEEQSYTSTVFFSLKEAFYKLQYPLTHTFLHFHDVEICMERHDYCVKMLTPTSLFNEGDLLKGNILLFEDEVITYCTLPA